MGSPCPSPLFFHPRISWYSYFGPSYGLSLARRRPSDLQGGSPLGVRSALLREIRESKQSGLVLLRGGEPEACLFVGIGAARLMRRASGEHFLPGEVSHNVVMDRAIEEAIREADRWAEESNGVIRWQNLLVSVIPIRVLKYRYGGRSFQITVYGYDPKVLCDDLPRPSLLSFFCLNNLM